MKDTMCVSKKTTYVVVFVFIIFLFVLISKLALSSNQAKNSKAIDSTKMAQLPPPQANPPSLDQQNPHNIYSVSLDNSGYIELLGTPPLIEVGKTYSIYLKRGDSFIHLDTFVATDTTLSEKFSYWQPKVKVTAEDVHTGVFYFFPVN